MITNTERSVQGCRRTRIGIAIVFVLLGGCAADLAVYPLAPQADNPPLDGDISYYLPRTAITLSGTTTIKKCDAKWDNDNHKYIADIEVTTTLTPLQSTEPDPDAHFYVSYKQARSWMKEINYSINNTPGGMLQTFNGTINDQVGSDVVAAIGTVVQIGGAVATAGVGAPGILKAGGAPTPPADIPIPVYCLPDVISGLKDIETQTVILKKAQSEQPKDAAAVAAQTQAIQHAQSAIDGDTKKGKLARSFSFKWVPKLGDQTAEQFPYKFFAKEVTATTVMAPWFSAEGHAWLESSASSRVAAPFLVTLAVDERSMGNPQPPITDYKKSLGGLVIRDPAKAILRVCRRPDSDCVAKAAAIPENDVSDTTNDIGARLAVVLPQFGRIMLLPEHSGLYENANLTVTLNADGSISTIGYHSASTAATGVTGVGTAASGVTSAVAARNTAIGAVNTAAAAETTANINKIQGPDTYNKALADCLTQQAAIVKAGGTPGSCK
jgi:hypothetical protein